jgi:Tfp pilus assembly protein PilV
MYRLYRLGRREQGTSLIEMMLAMLVLTIGLVGSMAVVSLAIGSNSRSKKDSTSAAVAEMVVSQIAGVCPNGPCSAGNTSVTLTDCGGNTWTIDTTGTTAGAGANLTSSGNIDFTQSYSSVTTNYAMKYTVCGVSNGTQTEYDVRWNVKLLPSGKEQFVVVGAQFLNSNSTSNARAFAPAVNVRTVIGNDGT